MGCKRSLVLEMEVRVSVYLIIIIRLYVAINELLGRKAIFERPKCTTNHVEFFSLGTDPQTP